MLKVLRGALPFALFALAQDVDVSVGLLLRTGLHLRHFALLVPDFLDLRASSIRAALLAGLGAALASLLSRFRPQSLPALDLLYLKPIVSVLALLSISIHPAFPYASTLPVALSQDLHPAVDLAIAAAVLASLCPPLRLPAPRAGEVFFVAFLAYALLSPDGARRWHGHTGNEPKYLRMGATLALRASLDVEPASALEDSPLEALEPMGALEAASRAAHTLTTESLSLLGEGTRAFRRGSIRASRIERQTIRGKDGGIYHVLAPGTSFLLAPMLRIDRAWNMAAGTPGRLRLSLLFWNALAAGLSTVLYLLIQDLVGGGALALFAALGASLLPPFLFYSYQFYPEMLGGLVLVILFRALVLARRLSHPLVIGLLLGSLPWLHQKFLPVWAILGLLALIKAVEEMGTLTDLVWLLAPQAASLYFTLLWNYAVTGCARPDALYLAWGPAGVSSAHFGEGVLGLFVDARFGLLPYVPVLLLFPRGLLGERRLWPTFAPALAYYLTVAAADNWSGAVCNLGRYLLPIAPLLVAGVACALASRGRGALALALILLALSGLFARLLFLDPRAANDSALLLQGSTFADGDQYIPNLFFRTWNYAAPGHIARILAWGVLVGALAWGLGRFSDSPAKALYFLFAAGLAIAAFLERWPSPLSAPRFHDGIRFTRSATAYVSGNAEVQGGEALLRSGATEIFVCSGEELESLPLAISGDGRVQVSGHPPLLLAPGGLLARWPLERVRKLEGLGGYHETVYRLHLEIQASGPIHLAVPGNLP